MKLTAEMIETIKEQIDAMELDMSWGYIGVRVQDVPFELGEIDHNSHIWIDGEDSGEELDGICATQIDMLSANEYYGDYVAIIVSDDVEYGEDAGEMIMKNAQVAAIIR